MKKIVLNGNLGRTADLQDELAILFQAGVFFWQCCRSGSLRSIDFWASQVEVKLCI
jgi:hypothetical protein